MSKYGACCHSPFSREFSLNLVLMQILFLGKFWSLIITVTAIYENNGINFLIKLL